MVAKTAAGRAHRRHVKAIAGLTAPPMQGEEGRGMSAHPATEPNVGSSNLPGVLEKSR
jgi:hypothetical protein